MMSIPKKVLFFPIAHLLRRKSVYLEHINPRTPLTVMIPLAVINPPTPLAAMNPPAHWLLSAHRCNQPGADLPSSSVASLMGTPGRSRWVSGGARRHWRTMKGWCCSLSAEGRRSGSRSTHSRTNWWKASLKRRVGAARISRRKLDDRPASSSGGADQSRRVIGAVVERE